jgi:hypothetical protein
VVRGSDTARRRNPRLHHDRNRDGVEVDAVLEAADGRVVGIEVKAGATVRAGFVLYTGGQGLSFGERLRALPIDALRRLRP